MDERIIDKIRKCLKLASDAAAAPQEAATAARMAEALLRKHQLEIKDVILAELKSGDAAVIQTWVRCRTTKVKTKRVPPWAGSLSVAVANLFDCKAYIDTVPEWGQVVFFVGYKEDIEICKWTFDYLVATLGRANKAFREAHGQDTKLSNSFRLGFVNALYELLRKALQAKQQETQEEQRVSTGTSLVVVQQAKSDAIARHLGWDPQYRKAKTKTVVRDTGAYYEGLRQGRQVNISPAPLAGATTQGVLK